MTPPLASADLVSDLNVIGIEPGDSLMVHAGLRSIGPMLNGPETLIAALRDALGPEGTLMAYTDWNADYEAVLAPDGSVPDTYRAEIAPYDPQTSRACRANGSLPEFVRTTPGASRSANPGASCAALGAQADRLICNHTLDYGYGPDSPFARLCDLDGKVLLIGCPLDTMTLLHHAEHLAALPGKRVKRAEVPLSMDGTTQWYWYEEFETSMPVSGVLPDHCFTTLLSEALAAEIGHAGPIGGATAHIFPASRTRDFAIAWMENAARAACPGGGDAPFSKRH